MRESRTRKEISEWMTRELRKQPECADARASVQYELQEPDPDGCNWSDSVLVNCGESDRDDVLARLVPIVRRDRRSFNVSGRKP